MKEVVTNLCKILEIKQQLIMVPNTSSEQLTGYPDLSAPINFCFLLDIAMTYTDFSNTEFVSSRIKTGINFIQYFLEALYEYMTHTEEEFSKSQQCIKDCCKNVPWVYYTGVLGNVQNN